MRINTVPLYIVSTIIILLLLCIEVHAGNIKGVGVDRLTNVPVQGVTVQATAHVVKYKSQSAVI